MLTQQQVEAFARDGFGIGSHFLSDGEVEELRGEIERVIRDSGKPGVPQPVICRNMSGDANAQVWQIVNIWEASDAFRRLLNHPVLAEELAQLADAEELRVWHDQVQYKPAAKGGVNWWHQDSIYWPPLQPKDAQLTAWVALDDVDPENGCMSMVPGSQRWGDQMDYLHRMQRELGIKAFLDLPREFNGQPIEVRPCPVRKGQVHFHHALTWHGSQANASGRPRRAVAIHVMNERTWLDPKGDHPMKPFVESAPGEPIRGAKFPLVWSREAAAV